MGWMIALLFSILMTIGGITVMCKQNHKNRNVYGSWNIYNFRYYFCCKISKF